MYAQNSAFAENLYPARTVGAITPNSSQISHSVMAVAPISLGREILPCPSIVIMLLSSGDYPKVAVEECLQAVGGEVLHVRIRQTRENRKNEQVPYKFMVSVLHRCVHECLYLLLGEVAPIHAFG